VTQKNEIQSHRESKSCHYTVAKCWLLRPMVGMRHNSTVAKFTMELAHFDRPDRIQVCRRIALVWSRIFALGFSAKCRRFLPQCSEEKRVDHGGKNFVKR